MGELLPAGSTHRGLCKCPVCCDRADSESAVEPAREPSLLAPFLPSAFLIFRLRIQMVPGVFSPFFFYFSYTGIFVLLSFTLWACGCLSQPLVPVGAGRREVWEEILATTRQMTQGLSTVHRAMLLVEPNHVSEAGKGAISHQEICGGLGG